MEIILKKSPSKWHELSKDGCFIYFSGTHFDENKVLLEQMVFQIKKFGLTNESRNDYISIIKSFKGFFAFIIRKDRFLIACVDHVRSIPLFYRTDHSQGLVSDSVSELIKPNDVWNEHAETQFVQAGYTLNENTLILSILQVEAGSCLIYSDDQHHIFNHFQYYCPQVYNFSLDYLTNQLMEVYDQIFLDIRDKYEKDSVILPLSGGLDSRLMAIMFKRHGFKNVSCFYYGRENDEQKNISLQTADKLGFKWNFIEYTRDKWLSWWKSDSFNKYRQNSHQWNSLPHIDDWPAIYELTEKKLIDPGGILFPGHTGDFISSGHLQSSIHRNNLPVGKEKLIQGIIDKHLSLTPFRHMSEEKQGIIKDCVIRSILDFSLYSMSDIAKAFEYWEWRNRQSRYIINSVRVYDHFGLKWYLPFWEKELLNFWMKIPAHLKISQSLYKKYICLVDKYDVFPHLKNIKHSKKSYSLKNLAKQYLKDAAILKYLMTEIYALQVRRNDVRYGIFRERPEYVQRHQRHIVSPLCLLILDDIKACFNELS